MQHKPGVVFQQPMAATPKPKGSGDKNEEQSGSVRPVVKSLRWAPANPNLPAPRVSTEAHTRRIVVYGALIAFALTALLVLAAVLQLFVFDPRTAVATVGDTTITKTHLQSRIKLDYANVTNRYNNLAQTVQQAQAQSDPSGQDGNNFLIQFYQQQLQQAGSQIDAGVIARNSLSGLLTEQLIRQEAAARGIAVTNDEVTRAIQKEFGFFLEPLPTSTPRVPPTAAPGATAEPLASPEPPPTSVSEAELQTGIQRGGEYYKSFGLPVADFRALFELRLLEQKLRENLGKDIPRQDTHFQFDYIRYDTEQAANEGAARAASNPAGFAELISTTNAITLPQPAGNGEQVEWLLNRSVSDRFSPAVLAALDSATVGKVTTAFSPTINSFYVLLPRGKEVRLLSDGDVNTAQRERYDAWLNKAQEAGGKVTGKTDNPVQYVPKIIRDQITQFQQNQR